MSKVTDGVTLLAIGIGGYAAWKMYVTFRDTNFSALPGKALSAAANAVDVRDTTSSSETWLDALLGGRGMTGALASEQSFVAETTRRGQEAGSTTFIGSFFTGLFTPVNTGGSTGSY